MNEARQEKHIIDVIFVLALFAVFAFSTLVLVIIGADIYSGVTDRMEQNYDLRTKTAYIMEKVRSADENGGISITEFDGVTALQLESDAYGRTFCTYLYEYDGNLCELYTDPSYGLSASSGTVLLPIEDFQMEAMKDNLYRISFKDEEHTETVLYVHIMTN